ncbi:terminase gpA endonuclease subunit [Maricaulis maris]|uniref:Phage terminase large subunit GpA-like protein n=1 Tax=Maricaulis maris TaxID=74318 RepID=A0A495D1J5_9PROT|nr:terminase gpA endonuclease subunit [Maricaulis maris]RKQ95432.1 phage terminase large subunit GpA-like protein [Maricaulis maris]
MPDGSAPGDQFADWPEFDAHLDGQRVTYGRLLREAITPDPPQNLLDWTCNNRVFDDMSSNPGPYDPDTAPYLNEPIEALSVGSGVEELDVIKCAQSGGTVILESFKAGLLSTVAAPAMLVHPTIRAFEDWAEEKWWPFVYATPALDPDRGGEVRDRTDKKSGGSTGKRIRFRKGGWIVGAGSNSAATLRQKSIRFMALDDLDGFELSAAEEGDPENLAHQRTKTYRRRGLAVTLRVSTPLLEGSSRIMKHYGNSDRRRFYHRCKSPECRAIIDFDWEDVVRAEKPPYRSHVNCPACKTEHRHGDKQRMQITGAWIPTAEFDGEHDADGVVIAPPKVIAAADVDRWRYRDMKHLTKHRGYWITGFMNFAETWDSIAEAEDRAGTDPEALKVFNNTVLGRTFKIESKTPTWEALHGCRSDGFRRGEGAYGPCVFVLSVDVQSYGLYWLSKGYNANEEQWYLDWGLIPGETDIKGEGAWKELDKIAERGAPLPGGNRVPFDVEVVDTNYNTDAAKAWVGRRPLAIAVNGDPGWGTDIIKLARRTEVGKNGKKKKFGPRVWHVSTWSAKAAVVARYGRTTANRAIDETGVPKGYCWLPMNADEALCRQLTSEYLHSARRKTDGLMVRTWKVRTGEENHLFDCDIYSFAGICYLGARAPGDRGSWTLEDWIAREERIRDILDVAQRDLFDQQRRAPEAAANSGAAARKSSDLPSALAAMAAANRAG